MGRRTRFGSAVISVLTMAGALALAGCQGGGGGDAQPSSHAAGGVRVPQLTTPESVYLFNPYTQHVVAYDVDAHEVTGTSTGPDFAYYGFNPPTQLYTSGSTASLGFSIVEISDRGVQTLATAPAHTGYFPLAASGSSVFLVEATYEAQQQTGNAIVRRAADGKLSTYADVDGAVFAGAIAQGRLYYSVFNEKTTLYDVSSVEIDDPASTPRPEKSGLEYGYVYAHHGDILFLGEDGVRDGKVTFPCTDLCYFYDDPDVVVRIAPDDDQALVLTAYDGATGRELGAAGDVVGFAVGDGGVHAYCEGSETTIPVEVGGS